ncbi:paraquat-inducible protein A [Uliginosibacterium sediminicola]|uniref:Paraquat-inducible protein A n=1 Tax=Uliginosibacterium sediminicola TaxID=2024550 RepID=A0ABU9Z2V9_9RHOO
MRPPRAAELGLIACHCCDLVCEYHPGCEGRPCPRCGSRLQRRRPDAQARAWALLIAGVLLYIPANLLPIVSSSLLGKDDNSTILSSILDFWNGGSWGIALLVFGASVVVPCVKFLALAFLLLSSRRGSTWAGVQRTHLYRLLELFGYWSMLDVMVVAMLAAAVNFPALGEIEPAPGVLFFGAMVIVTMLSTMSFDPRSIWDGDQT